MARATPPFEKANNSLSDDNAPDPTWDVELLRVLVSRKGTQVEAQWAIHPQLKQDLHPDEWHEVTKLMAKATDIVGARFSKALTDAASKPQGNA
jgi:hypothetical protein